MRSMSANKRIWALILALACVMALASCGDNTLASGEALILPVEGGGGTANGGDLSSAKLTEVKLGSVARTYSTEASVRYATQEIYCDIDDAYYAEYFVSAGDTVSEGDPIVRFNIDHSSAELQRLNAELEIARTEAERREASARDAVKAAREALGKIDAADARAHRRAELNLERAEIQLAATIASNEVSVAAAQRTVEDFTEKVREDTIYAPADGLISSLEFIRDGAPVPRGTRICTFISYEDFSLSANCDLSGAVRHGQSVKVTSNILSAPIESRVVDAPMIRGEETGAFGVELPPEVVELANDMISGNNRFMPNIRVEVERYSLDDVVVVPNSALQTENGKRYVYVVRDGALKKRFVATGLSDEKYTQILDGLEPGEYVSVG